MAVTKFRAPGYKCTECGWTASKWVGRCGECQQWGTVVEVAEKTGIVARAVAPIPPSATKAARPITEVETATMSHRPTGVPELDRVLGGGIVPGAVVLLSGEPGVGKSTLLLEVASKAAAAGQKVLYVSAEESTAQVRLRAERTGAMHSSLYLAAETDLGTVLGQIDDVQPELLIVDSVQTVSSGNVEGLPGGPSQVREVASALIRLAKERALPLVLVGHVTKDGSIAGPRLLEHLVDVVCHFEGDRHTALRFLRSLKNRFGPTDEVGCFEMTNEGITEIPDPSAMFLSNSPEPTHGVCVTIAMEGRRPLAVEIQALVTSASGQNPRRVTNGVDNSRVLMLLAALERHAGIKLSDSDVYVSTVGGVKLSEPSADLAIAIAIASAFSQTVVRPKIAAFGEISLAGEIRPTTHSRQRGLEADRLGHTSHLDSSIFTLGSAIMDAIAKLPAAMPPSR
ncbi:DNA repair protein RadA [Microbacteriaceae bacterium VKM Ac-2855]|nr:DNA repair protein RadA [Microbacteriaceae bacterium VKM Ac-2855]